MNEAELCAQHLPLAKRVARRVLYKDPVTADSVAGWALLRAVRSFDARIPLEPWVVYVVKIDCYHYLRSEHVRAFVELRTEEFWETTSCEDTFVEDLLTDWEWWVLICRYELKYPIDVVAKRGNITTQRVRGLTERAVAKLQKALHG